MDLKKPSVIVYGPPACGKTSNAEQIAQFLGLGTVVDDGEINMYPRRAKPVDCLFLCTHPYLDLPSALQGLQKRDFYAVMHEMHQASGYDPLREPAKRAAGKKGGV